MAVQKQDDQHEHTSSSYVRIRDVVLRTCLGRWTIGRSGERGSGISVLPARHDDDDIYIYIYMIICILSLLTHTHAYTHKHIYICVCVCARACVRDGDACLLLFWINIKLCHQSNRFLQLKYLHYSFATGKMRFTIKFLARSFRVHKCTDKTTDKNCLVSIGISPLGGFSGIRQWTWLLPF